MAGLNALDGGSGSLLDLTLRVKPGTPSGTRLLDLQWAELNDGELTLTPAPQPGADPTDAEISIAAPLNIATEASGAHPQGAAGIDSPIQSSSAPSAVLIDWTSTKAGAPIFEIRTANAGSGSSWVDDFVTNLGQSSADRNPNDKLRISAAIHSKAAPSVSLLKDRKG
jgi:hypothetical protein